nr:retrovirus-related Pol polyprotein from transposon TNT 1-94 [Tanacetum cinerariifolium]
MKDNHLMNILILMSLLKVSSDQNGQNDQSVQNDEIINDGQFEHLNHISDEQIIENLLNTKDIQIPGHSSSPNKEDTLVQNTIPIPNSSLSIPYMVTLASQDRWSQDKHIKLVNIIGNLRAGMLTRTMAKELSAASAHECLFVDFLFEEEPKKEDIIHKLNKKTREKVVPYPRFISLLLEYMMLEYDHEDLTINPTQVFSFLNWALKPNQHKGPPFTDHMKAICNIDVPVESQAPKTSSQTKKVPQRKKPRAKSGLRRKQSLKHISESQTEASKSKTGQSDKDTQSSSAKDKSLSHASPSTPVVGEMHKEAQQQVGTNPSVLVDKTKSIRDGLKTAHTDSGTNEESRADENLKKIKLEDLLNLMKDTRSTFLTLDSSQDEPIIILDESKKEETTKDEDTHTTSYDVPEDTSEKLEQQKEKIEAKVTSLKARPSYPDINQITKLMGIDIELPDDLNDIPTKLETFTSTVSSPMSQVVKLKTLKWELPAEVLALPIQILSVQAKLQTLDSLLSLLNKFTNTLTRFVSIIKNASKGIPLAGPTTASPTEGEKNTNPTTKDTDTTNLHNELIHLLGIDLVTREDGTIKVIQNVKVSDLHLAEGREDEFEWKTVKRSSRPSKMSKLLYTYFTKLIIDYILSHNKNIPYRSNSKLHSSQDDQPVTKLLSMTNSDYKFRMEVPDAMISDAIIKKAGSELTVDRQTNKAVVDMYNEWGQKLKGPAVDDLAVQSLLDIQKGSKASRLESLRQKKQPVSREGSSAAHNKYYDSSDTNSDSTLYSSSSDKLEKSANETDDAHESNMDLSGDNPDRDDDSTRRRRGSGGSGDGDSGGGSGVTSGSGTAAAGGDSGGGGGSGVNRRRVRESDIDDRIDRSEGNNFGFAGKSPPEKFSGGGSVVVAGGRRPAGVER